MLLFNIWLPLFKTMFTNSIDNMYTKCILVIFYTKMGFFSKKYITTFGSNCQKIIIPSVFENIFCGGKYKAHYKNLVLSTLGNAFVGPDLAKLLDLWLLITNEIVTSQVTYHQKWSFCISHKTSWLQADVWELSL